MSAAHGPNTSTAVGEVVSVALSGDASFGVNFSPDASGIGAFVGSWDRVSGGKFGPIQSHGGVHLGDFLCALNDTQLDHLPFAEVMLIINDRNLLKKNLTFISSHRNRIRKDNAFDKLKVADRSSGDAFLSIIRRVRVSCGEGKRASNKFAEYEIACQMSFSAGTLFEIKSLLKWSVWKRFSEFKSMDKALQKSLGWLVQSIHLPSDRTFVYDKTSPEFMELRREELNSYWQQLIKIDKITEFRKHHCSKDIKEFLNFDAIAAESKNGTKKAKEIIVESSDPINTAEIETEVRALSSSSSSTSTNGPQNHQNQSLSRLRRTSGDRKQLDTRHTNEGVVHLKLNQSQSHDRSVPTVPVGESRSLTTNSQISAPSPLNVTSNATHPPPPPPVITSSVPIASISKPQQPADAGRRDLFSAINSLRKKDG